MAPSTAIVINALKPPISIQWRRVRIASSGSRGGRCMTVFSPSPTPRASAGKTSVTRFRNRIWSGRMGSGALTSEAREMTAISLTLHDRR